MTRRTVVVALLLAFAASLFGAAGAEASSLITRNAAKVTLRVDKHNRALVSFTTSGRRYHSLWWGAMNARWPDPARPDSQRRFKKDYSGGGASFGDGYWRTMRNVCGTYTGPDLPMLFKACTMPTGDHWVLQRWKRLMPNGGYKCCKTSQQGKVELRLSHFKGELPVLWLKMNYSIRKTWGSGHHLDQLYGRYTYRGKGLYGFSSTAAGAPTDSYGILIWVDTFNSSWGNGWRRVNSFLTHRKPGGAFCDTLWPNRFGRKNSPGNGERYRAFADGGNALPVVRWDGPPPGAYNVSADQSLAGLGDYTIVDWLRHPFDKALADALADEQRTLSCHVW
ncbi:MAG: hypothetical protein QOF68_436 [Gaiellales bacterium]|jgi:hypothetical protein|nr:hypothetical protein [Gaiellales bacterium]